MVATVNKPIQGQLVTQSYNSITVTIADQDYASWSVSQKSGFILVSSQTASGYGQAWVRPTASPVAAKIAGAGSFAAVATALNGTTGTAGNVTLGVQNGVLYLENRSGASLTFDIAQIIAG